MDVFRRLFHAGESAGDAVGATEAAVGVKADAECAENAAISQEFLDRFPGGMFRYAADDSDEIEYANAGLLIACSARSASRPLTAPMTTCATVFSGLMGRCVGWKTGAIWWKTARASAGST